MAKKQDVSDARRICRPGTYRPLTTDHLALGLFAGFQYLRTAKSQYLLKII
jgi:hypothetical protein